MEEWKNIEHFDGRYQVSNYGRIRNTKTNRILKCTEHRKDKYLKITITYKKKVYGFWVNRLVLTHFNPHKFSERLEVHHIDFDRQNNRLENLMWVTHKENLNMRRFLQHTKSYQVYIKLYEKYGDYPLFELLNKIP